MAATFSIITITYNAERELPATLASVAEQTYTDYEYLIVDGASSDGTVALAQRSGIDGIRIVSERDGGLYDAMNKGIALATGKYLIFMNAGDAFHRPTTLAQYAEAARNNPDIIYGQTQLVDAERRPKGMRHLTAPPDLRFESFRHGMLVCHQSMAVRREMAEPYDLQYRFSADYEWCLRFLKKIQTSRYIDDIVTDYLTDGLTDRNHRASLRERYRIMCKYYGTIPTTLRHVVFALRNLKRKLKK
ncbi:MAG: glycosyltransferase family 2 protein [Candidatus Limisoma sp.]